MNDIEAKFALFGLTEDVRRRLVHLEQLSLQPKDNDCFVVVETVIVQDGKRTIIGRDKQNA